MLRLVRLNTLVNIFNRINPAFVFEEKVAPTIGTEHTADRNFSGDVGIIDALDHSPPNLTTVLLNSAVTRKSVLFQSAPIILKVDGLDRAVCLFRAFVSGPVIRPAVRLDSILVLKNDPRPAAD